MTRKDRINLALAGVTSGMSLFGLLRAVTTPEEAVTPWVILLLAAAGYAVWRCADDDDETAQ